MASIIPDYQFDIFISYRHKDDKYDHWVTEFVNNLKLELDTTSRYPLNIYFDINPVDGLLENHDVDDSLKEKLKCLIFIPVISHTYCDENSFAWAREFRAFVEQASQDRFGMKIKLPSGNYASRVLPVIIHDLSGDEKIICERITGSQLRGIEFVYREPGVNRPLRPNEENIRDHTSYRNQINKVANAIKEMTGAMNPGSVPAHNASLVPDELPVKRKSNKKRKWKIILPFGAILLMIIAFLFFIYLKTNKPGSPVNEQKGFGSERSVAILPFRNLTNAQDTSGICAGITEEILNQLLSIEGLDIPSSTTSFKFQNSDLSIKEIARKMEVRYIIEGNVSISGNEIRIIVRLVNGADEKVKWSQDYNKEKTAFNIFNIQQDVANNVAEKLKITIDPEVKKRTEEIPTLNTDAYLLFLKATSDERVFTEQSRQILEEVIRLDPDYADAYTELATYWLNRGGHAGDLSRRQVLQMASPLLNKALAIDKNSVRAHAVKGMMDLWYNWDFKTVEKEYRIVRDLDPSTTIVNNSFSDFLLASGKFKESLPLTKRNFDLNKSLPYYWIDLALSYYFNDNEDEARRLLGLTMELFHESFSIQVNSVRLLSYLRKYNEEIKYYEDNIEGKLPKNNILPYYLGHLGSAYYKTGDLVKSNECLNQLLARARVSPVGSPSFFASAIYTSRGDYDNALKMLEKAFNDHEVEMYWLKVEPLFRPLHGDARFEKIINRIGYN